MIRKLLSYIVLGAIFFVWLQSVDFDSIGQRSLDEVAWSMQINDGTVTKEEAMRFLNASKEDQQKALMSAYKREINIYKSLANR